jgi:hypothetical protein
MKVRITSVTAPGIGEQISDATTALEDALGAKLENQDYGGGIEQFSAFYIAVDSDLAANGVYCKMHNKSGKYKDVVTGKLVRYVAIAIPLDPKCVGALSRNELKILLQDALAQRVGSAGI